jgi:chromosome partitioning protein
VTILAVVNQKGGSGKTTTTVNLAAVLGERMRRVLVLDLDPQASATSWLGGDAGGRGLLDVFTGNGNVADLITGTASTGVDLVPASPWLVGVDKALSREVGAETILKDRLRRLPARRWDYVLIDCPPALGILTVNALTAAAALLVPVEAHVMALAGLAQLLQTVDVVRDRLNRDLRIAGIVVCRVDERTRHARDVTAELRKRFKRQVFKTVIRENIRLAECPSYRQPINRYDRHSRGAADFRALSRELLKRKAGR